MPSNPQQNNSDIEALKTQVQDLQRLLKDKIEKQPSVILNAPIEVESVLFKWRAPERMFQKKDKQWYWTAALVVLIISVILLLFGQAILVGAVFAILFVMYVNTTVPPSVIEHKITTYGIRTAQQLFKWEDITYFWFTYKSDKEILNLETKLVSPKRLIFFFTKNDKPHLIQILKERVQYKEAPMKEGWVSKNADGSYIPLSDIEASVLIDKQLAKS